jgi:hypothetical protein
MAEILGKTVALILVLILAESSTFTVGNVASQPIPKEAPAPQWLKTYGPYGSNSVIQTSDGGYAILGKNATHNIHGYSSFWPLLIKTDSLGEMQWSNGYPSTYGFTGNSIIQTNDGGFVLCGQGDWLLKVNSLGNIVWQKTLGLGLRAYVLFAILSSQGDFIIAGTISNSTTGGSDAIIVKADQDGNVLWKQVFSINSLVGPLSVFASSITETPDTDYVLVGAWDNHPWLAKTDSVGNLLINRTYPELSDLQVFRSVIAEPNGDLTLTADNPSIIKGNQIFTAWFLKADDNGTITKSCLYYDSRPFWSLKKTSDGAYIALQDASLLKFDNSGEIQCNISFASIGLPGSVVETADGNYVVTGISSMEGGLQTIFLAKLSSNALFENTTNPTPTVLEFPLAAIPLLLSVMLATAGLLVYFKKHKHLRKFTFNEEHRKKALEVEGFA